MNIKRSLTEFGCGYVFSFGAGSVALFVDFVLNGGKITHPYADLAAGAGLTGGVMSIFSKRAFLGSVAALTTTLSPYMPQIFQNTNFMNSIFQIGKKVGEYLTFYLIMTPWEKDNVSSKIKQHTQTLLDEIYK